MKEKDLLARLESCNTGADLKRLFNSAACEEAAYGEAPVYRKGAVLLADKAKSWSKPTDVASAIMWLARLASFSPHRIIETEPKLIKERVARVLEAERAFLRKACAHQSATVRVAAAHALACCRNCDGGDLALLDSRLGQEKTKPALATVALASGVLARRLDGDPSLVRDKLRALFGHTDLLVRLCALAGAVMIEPAIAAGDANILSEAIANPVKLPAQWGWFWMSSRLDSRDLAAELCGRVELESPAALLDTLLSARLAVPGNRGLTDVLMRAAFPTVPPSGIALEELTAEQAQAVRSIAEVRDRYDNVGPTPWIERLGLDHWKWEERFFAAEHIAWRPLDVVGGRRWHFLKILAAFEKDELSLDDAVDAIVEGLSPSAAVAAVLHTGNSPAAHLRVAVAVLEQLERGGLDVVKAGRAAAQASDENRYGIIWILGALAAYRLRGEAPPAWFDDHVVQALGNLVTASPFDELFLELGAKRRERLLLASHAAVDADWEWPGMLAAHTAFTSRVARAMLEKVHQVPEQLDIARFVLERCGTKGRRLLAKLKLKDKALLDVRAAVLTAD